MTADRRAVVTGASSGIGAATARALAAAGWQVTIGARRRDRLEAVAAEIGARAERLDVTDGTSVAAFAAACPEAVDLLVNNAGGALGMDRIEAADESRWRTMWETNVLGLALMTRALLPRLRRRPAAHVVVVGSVSGFEIYPGGAGYTSAKHGARAFVKTLRQELVGEPIRITEICPGLVETEFSLTRFAGDAERAGAVYRGLEPLVAADIADCILWAATRPAHVNVDEIVVRPLAQATASLLARRRQTDR